MNSFRALSKTHAGLALALTLAACGGAAGAGKDPASPAGVVAASATGAATGGPNGAPIGSATTGASTAPMPPADGPAITSFGNNKPTIASTLLGKLAEAGIDTKNLPELSKLGGGEQTKVMNSFKKSLGVECNFCHTANFAADHPMKNVARRMWNENVRGITFEGGALYCDSCHQGKAQFLDKSDKKVLAAWMVVEYTKKMKRHGQQQVCATCHGEPFNAEFIESWKKK
jgi:predicted small secreted protein